MREDSEHEAASRVREDNEHEAASRVREDNEHDAASCVLRRMLRELREDGEHEAASRVREDNEHDAAGRVLRRMLREGDEHAEGDLRRRWPRPKAAEMVSRHEASPELGDYARTHEMLRGFLRQWGHGPQKGYYMANLGADFNSHLESELGRKTRSPWSKGKMTSWCKQVPGLEVVLLDGGETLQLAQVDV